MTLNEALISASDRFDKIIESSGAAAVALLKYPELIEQEPALKEFVKRATPRSHRSDRTTLVGRKIDKMQ